jgi:PAS domain S-box-containing protein
MITAFADRIDVLHVDDDPDFADLTATFLERENDRFHVETATSADEGLQRVADRPPDCIVSDYDMPGTSGVEFLDAVRDQYPELPFVLYTGKGSEAVAGEAISAGVTDYIQKESGTEQYLLLGNRIENAVTQYRSRQIAEQRKERLELFFRESPLGAIQWDEHVRVERLNERAEEILGYDEAELRGESWETIVAEDDRGRTGDTATQLRAAEGGARHVVNRVTRADGERRTIEWHNRTATGADGEIESIFSKFWDVTDRENRQQELEERETIIAALTDAVYVLDEDGRFTYVNDEFVELVGYDREQILGNGPSLIKDEEAVEQAKRQLGRLLSSDGPETITFEVAVQTRDGGSVVCADHMGVLPYDGDEFEGSVGTLRDITDRKEREQELREITGQYQTLVESFPGGAVFLYDTDLQVVRAGGTELSAVGLSSDELQGTSPHDRYPSETAEELLSHIEATLAGEHRTFEQEYRGEHYRIRTAPVRRDDGSITHAMVVSKNVTDRRERQRQLELVDRVLRHNVRNVMTAVRGTAETIRDESADRIVELSDRLIETAEKEREMVEVLQAPPDHDEIALEPVLRRVASSVGSDYPDATIAVDCPDDVAIRATGQFERAIEELVTNAIVHNDSESPEVAVSVVRADDAVRIEIADDGPRIPEMERDVLLGTEEQRPLYHGSGLGLWLVRSIVSRSDGSITFEENSPAGNVVAVELSA